MKFTNLVLASIIFVSAISCKKDREKYVPISSVNVINAVVGSGSVIANFGKIAPVIHFYATTPQIANRRANLFPIPSGNISFIAYRRSDTLNALYKREEHNLLELKPQGIYSIFLCGQVTPTFQPDALFTEDHPPYHPIADSSFGVRFINLSPGSNPVNVTLSSSGSVNEFSNLSYKGITDFKNYSASSTAPNNYDFEFRSPITNTVLATITVSDIRNGTLGNVDPNAYRFRNFTIVLSGLPGAENAFLVNNY